MMKLTREVRFSLTPSLERHNRVTNSWAGWPGTLAVAPFITLRCTVSGELESTTDYLCDIKLIDDIVRQKIVQPVCQQSQKFTQLETILQFAKSQFVECLPRPLVVEKVELCGTPYLSLNWKRTSPDMISLTHQFEFSAAHRLHNPQLDDEENRKLFGKCNYPSGHGHNYLVDVTISAGSSAADSRFDLAHLEECVKTKVIDRFDHKHLNKDDPEFKTLNPTVENITQVIFDLLQDEFGQALQAVRVYETPKTWAEVSRD